MAGQVTWSICAGCDRKPMTNASVVCDLGRSKVAGMVFDVARVRGLHPSLGDGWVHFDAQLGMLIPDSVATTVSTAFRGSMPNPNGPYPAARRSAASGGRGSGERRPPGRRAGRRPRDFADIARGRFVVADRPGLRGGRHPG